VFYNLDLLRWAQTGQPPRSGPSPARTFIRAYNRMCIFQSLQPSFCGHCVIQSFLCHMVLLYCFCSYTARSVRYVGLPTCYQQHMNRMHRGGLVLLPSALNVWCGCLQHSRIFRGISERDWISFHELGFEFGQLCFEIVGQTCHCCKDERTHRLVCRAATSSNNPAGHSQRRT